ncbi:uncharacterized protein LOC135698439 [Ochlerotatus camptorhynchus]|uniref:uncharacterized protein LOC135698439 n=1 Tax=Ochlerotatus camptorhynchus TaxID=644619 RepID=UPI0031E46EF8
MSSEDTTPLDLSIRRPEHRNGAMSTNYASKYFGVPRTTLQYRLSAKCKNKGTTGPYTVFTAAEARDIVLWLKTMERKGFPVTCTALVYKILTYLKANPRKTPFKNNVPSAGDQDTRIVSNLNDAEDPHETEFVVPYHLVDESLKMLGPEKIQLYKKETSENLSQEDRVLAFICKNILCHQSNKSFIPNIDATTGHFADMPMFIGNK